MRQNLFDYVVLIPIFFNRIVIPFLLGLAFLFFVINVIRYFVIGGHDKDNHTKARAQIIYSLAAFVLIFIFWGVVQLLLLSLGLNNNPPPCPDYLVGLPNSPCSRWR